MRRFAAILALVALTLLGGLTYGAHGAAALVGTITLTLDCNGNPERTTITNGTDTVLDLSGFAVTSLVNPRQGVEPFRLSGTLAPGAAITYQTGSAATGGNVPTRQSIYVNTDPSEGARLTTPYGDLTVLCRAGTGSLGVTSAPVPTATIMPTATAMPTARPIQTAVPTVAPTATVVPTATAIAPMPGLPNTGGGGGTSPSGPLAALLVALCAVVLIGSGLVARLALRRR